MGGAEEEDGNLGRRGQGEGGECGGGAQHGGQVLWRLGDTSNAGTVKKFVNKAFTVFDCDIVCK